MSDRIFLGGDADGTLYAVRGDGEADAVPASLYPAIAAAYNREPALVARVARLKEAVYDLLEGAGWLHEDREDYAPWIKAARDALAGEVGR